EFGTLVPAWPQSGPLITSDSMTHSPAGLLAAKTEEISLGARLAMRPSCRTDTRTWLTFCTAPICVRGLHSEPTGRETTVRITRGPAHCGMPESGSTSFTKTRTHLWAGLPKAAVAST